MMSMMLDIFYFVLLRNKMNVEYHADMDII